MEPDTGPKPPADPESLPTPAAAPTPDQPQAPPATLTAVPTSTPDAVAQPQAPVEPDSAASPKPDLAGQTIQPGGSVINAVPSSPAEPSGQPAVTVGGSGGPDPSGKVFTATAPQAPGSSRFKLRIPKKAAIPLVVVLILLAGAAAAYFGYYKNPSVIYRQSLSNTGKGYDSLIDYLDQQSKANNKGFSGSGTYQITSSGSATDGKLAYKSDGQNSDFTFDIGADVTRISADIRSMKSTGDTPDVYLKFSGIKGLGTALGDPALDRYVNKLDNQWIVVDHTFIDNLRKATGQTSSIQFTWPTHDQVLDEARAFGKVNQQYLFTTDKDKAVMKIVKKYGKEMVDGHETYHYRMALQPANVKKYILAQRDALRSSKLDAWLKQNNYETSVINSLTQGADTTKDINNSDDFDLWVDASHRVIYKIRVQDHPNPAENYVDIGLNYKGDDDYPLFLSGKTQDTGDSPTYDFSVGADINTKSHKTGFSFDEKAQDSSATDVSANFSLTPNTSPTAIAKPVGAIPLSQVLNELGLGGILAGGGDSGGSASSSSALTLGQRLNVSSTGSADAISRTLLNGLLGQGR